MLPQLSQYRLSDPHDPKRPFEDAECTIREEQTLTPTNDDESNQSFHTAAGDIDADGLAPVCLATLRSSVDLADGSDDIGVFHCQSCNITLWDAFEHK
jgi:hypothetical protein